MEQAVIGDVRAPGRFDLRALLGTADAWPLLRPVLTFHLLTRALIIGALVIGAVVSGRSFPEVVMRWDGNWYAKVADDGYPAPLPVTPTGRIESSTAAFFPLYPLLTKGLTAIGVPFWLGGMLINLVASSAAVLVIVMVGTQYLDRRSAQLLGCLWTVFPVSAALTVTYSEALFTLFGAASLYLMLRRHWILAGLAATLAGTVRPPGIVFAGAVGLAALLAFARERDWRSLLGATLAPLGFLATMIGIGLRAGRLDAWQVTEHDGWHTELTYGMSWLAWLRPTESNIQARLHLVVALFALALVVLAVVAILLRPPLPIMALIAVGAFIAFGFGGVGMNAGPRVMMAFFPVLAPPAVLLSRCPRAIRRGVLVTGSVVAAVVGAYYFIWSPIPV